MDTIDTLFSHENKEDSSLKEINKYLEGGEYIIMIYLEHSHNEAVIRFLCENDIDIYLIDKIDKDKLMYNYDLDLTEKIINIIFDSEDEYYKELLDKEKIKLPKKVSFSKEDFLPGMRDIYINFKKIANSLKLKSDEAIFSVSEEGEAVFYEIIDPSSMNKIFGRKIKNGRETNEIININTLQFRDNFGYPIKVKNITELIQEMKFNKDPLSCLFSEYDEIDESLYSGITHFKLYHNKATNDDILIITDKSGNYKEREQRPLLIINLDISGSMKDYISYLQNELIPKLLEKMGYSSFEKINPELAESFKKHNITEFELLCSMSSNKRVERFLDKLKELGLKNINLKDLKKFSKEVVVLITFTDKSEVHFLNISNFKNHCVCGNDTFFLGAATNLEKLLNKISKRRSIRLLTFSDGIIHDKPKSIKKLEEILKSSRSKHQMNSLPIRVFHGDEPDTNVLMKLSKFSNPINDMTQIVINPKKDKNIDKAADKIFNYVKDDGMEYNLKLISQILMSNDLSKDFSYEHFLNNKFNILKVKGHKEKEGYQRLLKLSKGKVVIENCGDLKRREFYDIMEKIAPFIAQRILERKVNGKKKSKENQEIIDFIKKIEEYFESKNPYNKSKNIADFFQEIDESEEIKQMSQKELFEEISKVKEETKDIIKNSLIEEIKNEKEKLKKDIKEVFPNIDEELRNIKNSETEEENEIPENLNITFDSEKEKYDNYISNQDFDIIIKNFENISREIIFLKSNSYNESEKIKSLDETLFDRLESFNYKLEELKQIQKQSILCLENQENILITSNLSAQREIISQYAISKTLNEGKKILYVLSREDLCNTKFAELNEIFDDVGIITNNERKNESAACIVINIEMLRNMIFKKEIDMEEIKFVIFNEINYLRDEELGVFLEEVIILLNNDINYIFLSDNFPNAREFGIWIAKIKEQPCNVIYSSLDSFQLKHYLFPIGSSDIFLVADNQKLDKDPIKEIFDNENFNKAFNFLKMNNNHNITINGEISTEKKRINKYNNVTKLITILRNKKLIPLIIISFSKRECENNAYDLYNYKFAKNVLDFNNEEEKESIEKIQDEVLSNLSRDEKNMFCVEKILSLLQRGIAFYHDGMLPTLKELVESLYQKGLIKILFCTENFMNKVDNNEIKTIVLPSLIKFEGGNRRYIGLGEYNKISRKAFENMVIIVDENIDQKICEKIIKGKPAPLFSSFRLSFNQIANLIKNKDLSFNYILSRSFYLFQQEKNLKALRKKLAEIYKKYLSNDFNENEYEKEAEIKDFYEMKNSLDKLNDELRRKIHTPKTISDYLCFGRIVKLKKYFGYGMVVNIDTINNRLKSRNKITLNNNVLTRLSFNKKIEEYDEEEIYRKHIGVYNEEEFLINNDNNNNNLDNIKINKKFMKGEKFLDEINKKNYKDNPNIINNNKPIIVNCLIPLKNHPEENDFLLPGNLEEDDDIFYGIIPFRLESVKEICNSVIKKNYKIQYKNKNILDLYGSDLEKIKEEQKKKIKALNINIKSDEINEIKNEIDILKNKYNLLKRNYIDENLDIFDEDNNDNEDLQRYSQNKEYKDIIKKIIFKLKTFKNIILNEELINMKSVMKRLNLLNNDGTLTEKGLLICDGTSGFNDLVIAELISSDLFKDMNYQDIGASICCCLSKENPEKKENKKLKDNIKQKTKDLFGNFFDEIIGKVKYVADILVEFDIFKEAEKNRYIYNFNNNYVVPILNWIDDETFDELIKECNTLYEGDLITIIRKLNEFLENIESSGEYIKDNELKNKLDIIQTKIKRGLPFISSFYLTREIID